MYNSGDNMREENEDFLPLTAPRSTLDAENSKAKGLGKFSLTILVACTTIALASLILVVSDVKVGGNHLKSSIVSPKIIMPKNKMSETTGASNGVDTEVDRKKKDRRDIFHVLNMKKYEDYLADVEDAYLENHITQNERILPEIAWLVSFPNSGTSYTLRLTRKVSGKMVASNYITTPGSKPGRVHDEISNSPYQLADNNEKYMPDQYILTKTHCGGRCVNCSPDRYVETLESFEEACVKIDNDVSTAKEDENFLHYDSSIVKRAVHLFRDPFDNVVSRFHLEFNHNTKMNNTNWIEEHPKTPEGFQNYCKLMDESDDAFESHYSSDEISSEMKRKKISEIIALTNLDWIKDVPCHSDFIRYVLWHNLSFELLKTKLNIPVHILHYVDYHENFENTVNTLFAFLSLERENKVPKFFWSDYSDYYSLKQRKAVTKLMSELASEETMKQIQRYLVV